MFSFDGNKTLGRLHGLIVRKAADLESRVALAKTLQFKEMMMGKRNANDEKLCESIRVLKCDIEWPKAASDIDRNGIRDTRNRWFELSRIAQRASNCYYEIWLVWHVQNRSVEKIEAWLKARDDLRKASTGTQQEINRRLKDEIGICPVEVFPDDLFDTSKPTSLYRQLTQRFPSITAHAMTVLMNSIKLKLTEGKAAHGSLPKWMSMLLHNERIPSFTNPLPVPFSAQDCKLVKEDGHYYIDVKLWRIPGETANGKPTTHCVMDRIKLYVDGRKNAQQRAVLPKIFSGEWSFKGSSLVFHERDKKWRVHLSFQRTTHVAQINGQGHAYLIAGCKNPFSVIYHDGKRWRRYRVGGRGEYIHDVRRRIILERATRSENYRRASARKGRGFNNANRWRAKSSDTWRYFVRRVNHQISRDVINWCVANGFSSLTYKQPMGSYSTSRFVSGDFKNSTWEFYQLGTMLAYKAQDAGVKFAVDQNHGCERSNDDDKSVYLSNKTAKGVATKNEKPEAGGSSRNKDRSKNVAKTHEK